MPYRFVIITLSLALSGCPGMGPKDHEELRGYADQAVSPGMPLIRAIEHLAKDDFQCHDRNTTPDIDCSRQKSPPFPIPHTCVQRLSFSVDEGRRTVVATTHTGIACTGF